MSLTDADRYRYILSEMVAVLIEAGMKHSGKIEGLIAYEALLTAKNDAKVMDVPLSKIGLGDFDIDAILNAPQPKKD